MTTQRHNEAASRCRVTGGNRGDQWRLPTPPGIRFFPGTTGPLGLRPNIEAYIFDKLSYFTVTEFAPVFLG